MQPLPQYIALWTNHTPPPPPSAGVFFELLLCVNTDLILFEFDFLLSRMAFRA
jgi:hypothetical protein